MSKWGSLSKFRFKEKRNFGRPRNENGSSVLKFENTGTILLNSVFDFEGGRGGGGGTLP